MKVVAFNGSARSEGNTAALIRRCLGPVEASGVETETVSLAGQTIHGCRACYKCFSGGTHRCAFGSDIVNDCIARMLSADAILLGSPTYFSDVSAEMKALIDRAGMVVRANGDLLRRKIGAAIVAVRRGGEIQAFDTMNHFFLISQMVVPGSCYWNMGIGRQPGEVENDEEGMRTMDILGENIAWLLDKLKEH